MHVIHTLGKRETFLFTDWSGAPNNRGFQQGGDRKVSGWGGRDHWTPDHSPNTAGRSLGQTLVVLRLKYFIWIFFFFTWSCCLKCLDLPAAAPAAVPQTEIRMIQAHEFSNNQQSVHLCLRSYRARPAFCSICNSYISSPIEQMGHTCVSVCISKCEITGGHTAPPARGGRPPRPSCRCKPPCGCPMTSLGSRRSPAGRPPPCLRWWWGARTARAACLPAPSQRKHLSASLGFLTSGAERLWVQECAAGGWGLGVTWEENRIHRETPSGRKESVSEFKHLVSFAFMAGRPQIPEQNQ